MRRGLRIAASSLTLALALAGVGIAMDRAVAQPGPESLLPPGFDRPTPRPTRAPAPAPRPSAAPRVQPSREPVRETPRAPAPAPESSPVVEPIIAAAPVIEQIPGVTAAATTRSGKAPSIAALEAMPLDQLDQLLGLRPKYDIPPQARRALQRVGLIDSNEGGLPPLSLVNQNASLVRAAIEGNRGAMVSRWGHILLRRALASRLDAPATMNPADFAAMRAALLVRMGEGAAARGLVQDVDPANANPPLVQASVDAYVATQDFTGACPLVTIDPAGRKDAQWQALRAICAVFSGNGAGGIQQLDHMLYVGTMPRTDMLLAQKYAGAAGKARRAVNIEWDGVAEMNPWRYGLTLATGLTPPAALMAGQSAAQRLIYDDVAATAPMVGLGARADAADRAGGAGVLSSAAMVDLYSQIYADDDVSGGPADRALLLRDAYLGNTPAARLTAMKGLWDGAGGPIERASRLALTAYAAARMPVSGDYASDAGDLIAAMLSAGLDANAARWFGSVESGSQGWALLVLAAPTSPAVSAGPIQDFIKRDSSAGSRRAGFLIAGLAGLGRVSSGTRSDIAGKLAINLDRASRWSRAIDGAAQVGNPALVAMLAGVGMQGDGWDKMTPRALYHIVAALDRVGLSAEARMIAAEAVARG